MCYLQLDTNRSLHWPLPSAQIPAQHVEGVPVLHGKCLSTSALPELRKSPVWTTSTGSANLQLSTGINKLETLRVDGWEQGE